MRRRKSYSVFDKEKIVGFIALIVIVIVITAAITASVCHGEQLSTCWIMCKPGSRVEIRATPGKSGISEGWLDCGDSFETDMTIKNGWIRCYDVGNAGEGWIYLGYVVKHKPEEIKERYICVANRQVACRRWIAGPQISRKPWLKNGQYCYVYMTDGEWAVTSRGYIKFDYLEVSPE
jgi:hypothetical protein